MRSVFIALVFSFASYGQSQIVDDFSDGELRSDPAWIGDTALFRVNQPGRLQLWDSVAGVSSIACWSAIVDSACWTLDVFMGFNPSSSNNCRIYLMSDDNQLVGASAAYFVQLGSTDDRISLIRQDGTSQQLLISSADDLTDRDSLAMTIRVTCSRTGDWMLEADTNGSGIFLNLGHAVDSSHSFSSYFGISCNYTRTRAKKFYFDNLNIVGYERVDTLPIRIDGVEVISCKIIDVRLSEVAQKQDVTDPKYYQLDKPSQSPDSVFFDKSRPNYVRLVFKEVLENKRFYNLKIKGLQDAFGNESNDSVRFLLFIPEFGDVLINEIMVDPTPVIRDLPEEEYVELYNPTLFPIDLSACKLMTTSAETRISTFILDPDEYVVVAASCRGFPPGRCVEADLPLLTNGSGSLRLVSRQNVTVHLINYEEEWYGDNNKRSGGWSLEQKDPGDPCGGVRNWSASADVSGGTPGIVNSILSESRDTSFVGVSSLGLYGDSVLELRFGEMIITSSLLDRINYRIKPAVPISRIEADTVSMNKVRLVTRGFVKGINYELLLEGCIRDCAGNCLGDEVLAFALPAVPEAGNILINEVLFNPHPGGSDFVEIYNSSDEFFDLEKLRIGNWDPFANYITDAQTIVSESQLYSPGSYLALTTDTASLSKYYKAREPRSLLEVSNLPSMGDKSGSVAISTSDLRTIDGFEYSDEMHLDLLEDTEGVSLERFTPKAGYDEWHSAAASAGFASPGYRNSHFYFPFHRDRFRLEPKVFSPDQDGHQDLLSIAYEFEKTNNVVSITIINSEGYVVRELLSRKSLPSRGLFTWDGISDSGVLQKSGIYIVVMDYFDHGGARNTIRRTCVLSR